MSQLLAKTFFRTLKRVKKVDLSRTFQFQNLIMDIIAGKARWRLYLALSSCQPAGSRRRDDSFS